MHWGDDCCDGYCNSAIVMQWLRNSYAVVNAIVERLQPIFAVVERLHAIVAKIDYCN